MSKYLYAIAFMASASLMVGQTSNYPNGSVIPNFTVTDVDGVQHDLYNYTAQGKHLLLAFWFVGCIPCEQTAPKVAELYETYGCNSGDLVVLRVNAGIDMDWQIAQFGALHGGPYQQPPAINEAGSAQIAWTLGVYTYPTYALIRPDNVVHNNAIWPVYTIQNFLNAFPPESDIQPMPCLTVDMEDHRALQDLRVFPVPTNGSLQVVRTSYMQGTLLAEVTDAAGRIVHNEHLSMSSASAVMDLEGLPNGRYLLTLRSEDGQFAVQQIVIAR